MESSGRVEGSQGGQERSRSQMLVVAHWNVRSLRHRRNVRTVLEEKVEFLQQYMEEHGIDVLGLSETHVFTNSTAWEPEIPRGDEFCLYLTNKDRRNHESKPQEESYLDMRVRRINNEKPGVGFLVKKRADFEFKLEESDDPSRMAALAAVKRNYPSMGKLIIIEAYAPFDKHKEEPHLDPVTREGIAKRRELRKNEFYRKLQLFLNRAMLDNPNIIIMGDFNATISEGMTYDSSARTRDNSRRLITFCKKNGLDVHTEGKNTEDHLLTRMTRQTLSLEDDRLDKPSYEGPKKSDHHLLLADLKLSHLL